MRAHIATDSGAHFAHSQLIAQSPVTIVPNTMVIGGRVYREGIDISAEQAMEQLVHQMTPPRVTAPSVEAYATLYSHLANHNEVILSIHSSRMLSKNWEHARAAAQQLEGHVRIFVIDSRTIDAAQGFVVRAALRAIQQYSGNIEQMVQTVRSATERVYSVYFVESVDYLMRNEILPVSHAVISAMHHMLPLVTMEDGKIVPIEKVKNRLQAVERLVEFVVEFDAFEDALILQHRPHQTEISRNLQERLALEFPQQHFGYSMYGASLAALIGVSATGLVLLERDMLAKDTDF